MKINPNEAWMGCLELIVLHRFENGFQSERPSNERKKILQVSLWALVHGLGHNVISIFRTIFQRLPTVGSCWWVPILFLCGSFFSLSTLPVHYSSSSSVFFFFSPIQKQMWPKRNRPIRVRVRLRSTSIKTRWSYLCMRRRLILSGIGDLIRSETHDYIIRATEPFYWHTRVVAGWAPYFRKRMERKK